MSKSPVVIVAYSVKEVQDLTREFVQKNAIQKFERKGQCKFRILSNDKEIWIMHSLDYREWCLGRTYWHDNKLMHSGYELKEKQNEN